MLRECSHGIVAGTCNDCLANALDFEGRAVEEIWRAVRAREMDEAIKRTSDERKENSP